jgi:hypothetical protein
MAALAAGVGMLALAGTANAATLVYNGTDLDIYVGQPSPTDEKVYLSGVDNTLTICGTVGSNAACTVGTNGTATLSASENIDSGNGFSNIKASDGGEFANLTFSLVNLLFTGLAFNVQLDDEATQLTVAGNFFGGGTESYSGFLSLAGWNNASAEQLYVVTKNGKALQNLVISALISDGDGGSDPGGIFELKQFVVETTPIPLPPAVLLFGTALAGVGFMSRRKKAANAA